MSGKRTSSKRSRKIKRKIKFYNLDMIIYVEYRVKYKRGITFRKWATSNLKDYMIQDYTINQKRLEALNKTIEIQSRIIANALETMKEMFMMLLWHILML